MTAYQPIPTTGERYPPPTEPLSLSLPPSRAAAPHSPPQTRSRVTFGPHISLFFLHPFGTHPFGRPPSSPPTYFRHADAPRERRTPPAAARLALCLALPRPAPSLPVLLGLFCWVLSFVPFVLSALHTFASVGADLRYLLRTPGPSPNAVGALSRPPT